MKQLITILFCAMSLTICAQREFMLLTDSCELYPSMLVWDFSTDSLRIHSFGVDDVETKYEGAYAIKNQFDCYESDGVIGFCYETEKYPVQIFFDTNDQNWFAVMLISESDDYFPIINNAKIWFDSYDIMQP